jgi:formate dehydrogenase major subunit
VPGLGISFGRGGATTFQQDLQNADLIVIQGSNMAECHPVGFQWVMEAKARGAKIVHVDPRFTRTSAMADLHVPIRAGSDIAFLGGIIRYILENDRAFKEYVVDFTNAATIVTEEFADTEDLEGFFSGWNAKTGEYDTDTWKYAGVGDLPAAGHKEVVPQGTPEEVRGRDITYAQRDPTLQHPRCVYQILKKHYARYTPEKVSEICGVPPQQFLQVCELLCENSGPDRTGAFCYAVGWTQHTVGVQYIRSAAIIQLLLGNIGRPGGGILALRGHASIQGSTDIPTLFNLLPGYLPMPHANHDDLREYLKINSAGAGFWSEYPAYFISLMKAWFGDAATEENDWGFRWLPAVTGDHSHMTTVADMAHGRVRGYLVMGENPAVGSSNGAYQREGLRKLDWLVVRDLAMIETADFWRNAPEVVSGEIRPEQIGTEVFFFPAAAHTEKDGSFTNTQRMLQWHHKAVEPPGDCRSDLQFAYELGKRLRELYADSPLPRDRPIRALTWDYPEVKPGEPDAEAVLAEINGRDLLSGRPLEKYTQLKADGTTAAGCWIYVGARKDGVNQAARRKPGREQDWVALEWGWAWPDNRRILYNRASARPDGKPWSERKKYVWWDEEKQRWTGYDNPDFIIDRPPAYRPILGATGLSAISGNDPFILQVDGKGWLYAAAGLLDGPMPAHYEPQESPVENLLYKQQCNPRRLEWHGRKNPYHRAFGDPRFPYVLTTYRLTEHHTAGGMSRWLSWLSELMPEMFCEVSPELAAERGLHHGGWATVRTARGDIECRVLVTRRLAPLRVAGRTVHQIGLPYHWGYTGRVRGDSTNDLLAFVADPNVHIQESKALTGDIRSGRRRRTRRAALGGVRELPGAQVLRDIPGLRPFKPQPLQHDPAKE